MVRRMCVASSAAITPIAGIKLSSVGRFTRFACWGALSTSTSITMPVSINRQGSISNWSSRQRYRCIPRSISPPQQHTPPHQQEAEARLLFSDAKLERDNAIHRTQHQQIAGPGWKALADWNLISIQVALVATPQILHPPLPIMIGNTRMLARDAAIFQHNRVRRPTSDGCHRLQVNTVSRPQGHRPRLHHNQVAQALLRCRTSACCPCPRCHPHQIAPHHEDELDQEEVDECNQHDAQDKQELIEL